MKYKILKTGLLFVSFYGLANAANIAYIAKAAPGDTASAGAGKEWPATRFVVNGNCVTDNLTGLMWAKNANLLGNGTWGSSSTSGTAQYKVAQMNTNPSATGYQLCGYSDWRLSNEKELLSLFNYAASSGSQAAWLNSEGFSNVQSANYWSSTPGGLTAWFANMSNGASASDDGFNNYYIWPVRGGQ